MEPLYMIFFGFLDPAAIVHTFYSSLLFIIIMRLWRGPLGILVY